MLNDLSFAREVASARLVLQLVNTPERLAEWRRRQELLRSYGLKTFFAFEAPEDAFAAAALIASLDLLPPQ